jgi:hypothetical protein
VAGVVSAGVDVAADAAERAGSLVPVTAVDLSPVTVVELGADSPALSSSVSPSAPATPPSTSTPTMIHAHAGSFHIRRFHQLDCAGSGALAAVGNCGGGRSLIIPPEGVPSLSGDHSWPLRGHPSATATPSRPNCRATRQPQPWPSGPRGGRASCGRRILHVVDPTDDVIRHGLRRLVQHPRRCHQDPEDARCPQRVEPPRYARLIRHVSDCSCPLGDSRALRPDTQPPARPSQGVGAG